MSTNGSFTDQDLGGGAATPVWDETRASVERTTAHTSGPASEGSTTEQAKQAGAQAIHGAQEVGAETRAQAQQLLSQTKEELQLQATQSRDKLASGLRTLSSDMNQMAAASNDGVAAQAVSKLSEVAITSASFLEQHDPASLVSELRDIARQRPGLFLTGAAIAGGVAGRLTRAAVDQRTSVTPDTATTPTTEARVVTIPDAGSGIPTPRASRTARLGETTV